MIILEIAMFVVGLLAVAYSFKISEKKDSAETTERVEYVEYTDFPDKEWEEKIEKLKEQAEDVYNEIDDKISKLSNEKIMGMNEYSEQVLDKIEKNHGEVVFLYDMMNEKEAEIKKTVNEVDTMRAGLKDDAEKEFQKLLEKEETLDRMKQDIEMEALEIQAKQKEIKESQKEIEESQKRLEKAGIPVENAEKVSVPEISVAPFSEPESQEEFSFVLEDGNLPEVDLGEDAEDTAEKKESVSENISASDVIDAEIARIEREEENERKESMETSTEYKPLSEQTQPKNHNDEIIDLYKKGRSIIEISKMLSLGQGEVKFVIDLYNAR